MDAHEVKGTAREAAGQAERTYGRLKEGAEEMFGNASQYGDRIQQTIQEYPGAALSIALAAGYWIGCSLASRD